MRRPSWLSEPDLFIGRTNSDHLALWVVRRKYPEATDYWDGNWLDSWVELWAGDMRAMVNADLRANEYQTFRESLEQLESLDVSEAALESLEEWLTLRITRTSTGSLNVEGQLLDQPGIGNRVAFTLQSDLALADLRSMIRALQGIEERFPVLDESTGAD